MAAAAWSVWRADPDELPPSADALVVFAGETARTRLALQLLDDELAPVAVFSLGADDDTVAGRCGELEPVEVLCPTPDVHSMKIMHRFATLLVLLPASVPALAAPDDPRCRQADHRRP